MEISFSLYGAEQYIIPWVIFNYSEITLYLYDFYLKGLFPFTHYNPE